jgi:hypothetical protein
LYDARERSNHAQSRLITIIYPFELDFFGKVGEVQQGNDTSRMLKIQVDYAFLWCFSIAPVSIHSPDGVTQCHKPFSLPMSVHSPMNRYLHVPHEMECLSPSLYLYNMILLNSERGGWGDPSFPLKACGMTPVKVRSSNLIIDEITP